MENVGIKVYDPRTNIEKPFDYSLNSALIAAYYIEELAKKSGFELEDDFYRTAIENASYCDEVINV